MNLSAMNTMKDRFRLNIGYSDHTKGVEIAPIAVALGAQIIEKHLTLSNKMSGPDHKASIEPYNFKKMVNLIRSTEIMLGSKKKIMTRKEKHGLQLTAWDAQRKFSH
mgnify:CR=1 FL=1